MAQTANVVQLKPQTLQAFDDYIREAEEAMEPSLHGRGSFLWSDANPSDRNRFARDRSLPNSGRVTGRSKFRMA